MPNTESAAQTPGPEPEAQQAGLPAGGGSELRVHNSPPAVQGSAAPLDPAYAPHVCRYCGLDIIQPDVTMQGPRGPWVHEGTRTRKCATITDSFAEPEAASA